MAPLMAFSPSVVAWLLASVSLSVSSTSRPGATSTMSRLSAETRPEDLAAPSEKTGTDSFECGSGCFEGENEEGLDHDPRGSGGAVDLDELADRVNDALVAEDTDSTSSTPPSPTPSCSGGGDTTGKIGTGCEYVEDGGVHEESVPNEEGVLLAAKVHESEAATHQAADGTKLPPLSIGEMCGEGELQKICNPGETCCNSSCGICAPKGQSCLQIACGALKSEGDSQVAFAFQQLLLPRTVSVFGTGEADHARSACCVPLLNGGRNRAVPRIIKKYVPAHLDKLFLKACNVTVHPASARPSIEDTFCASTM